MKKYNTLILLCLCLYVCLALFLGIRIGRIEKSKDHAYRVEISRITQLVTNGTPLADISLDAYPHMEEVRWLSAEAAEQEAASVFFEAGNSMDMSIEPIYDKQSLQGYLRFDYQRTYADVGTLMVWTQLSLAILAAVLLGVLLYLRKHLLKPFAQVQRLPQELARGHWKGIVKEEKSRYVHEFLLGIGQLKDTLDSSRKRQLELEKEKKKLLLSLSHDIKTPLNTIQLYARALEEHLYEDEEHRLQAARQIQEKGKDIERYVEEIMRQSREDILDIPVHNSEFYLQELIEKVQHAYMEPLRLRHMELDIRPYDNLLLKGDLERSFEVVENIIENALKYGDGRRLEISCYEEDYCQLIRIYNTGNTVSDTELHHIFESFFRASNSEGKQGNGLGLYICREIMRRMNGEIFAQKEAEGMAFILVFPN